jgi:alcohol dehydrogenase class IV
MSTFDKANQLINDFKGSTYLHGMNILEQVGPAVAQAGQCALLVCDEFPGSSAAVSVIRAGIEQAGVRVVGEVKGAAPNAPREDLARVTNAIRDAQPDVLVSFGGGSTIDVVKAANVLACLGGSIDDYFGTGLVTQALQTQGKRLLPQIAIQTAASSGAHLTKYSNITDISSGQKKLVVDEAIVPGRPVFDYAITLGAPPALTADGALDGISHALEVLYSAVGKPSYQKVLPVALEAIRLVVAYLPRVLADPADREAREALGLATDLGGYAIMIGGTNGAHLTSFSLVDILSHGRACGLLNPYYTVFFAPAIEDALRAVGQIYADQGYLSGDLHAMSGRALGVAVAEAMISFERRIGFPATLSEVPGFSEAHLTRALAAARDPQLKMKLENMPIPLRAEQVDQLMGPVLQAAKTGDLSLIV